MKTIKSIGKESRKFKRISVLGVRVDDISLSGAVQVAVGLANRPNRGRYIVTVNPEFVMMAHRSAKFRQILAKSDLSVADGTGVVVSKLILGGNEHDRITGVDLLENVCKIANERAIKVGFLGGFGSVAEMVAQRQVEKYPQLDVAFAKPGEPTIFGKSTV